MNETGPYADGAYGQGNPQAQGNPYGQQQPYGQPQPYGQQGGAANGWPQQGQQGQQQGYAQAPGPTASGSWGQPAPAPNAWPQQAPQQPPNPWVQQAPQGYAPQQPRPPQPQNGLTPNPFALPGQNAYQGYDSAPQGQPVNPYAPTPLGVNTEAKRDDQNFFQRTGLSKGKTVWLGVLLLAAAGFWTYDKFFSDDPSATKVGDCVHTDTSAYDVKKVACTDPGATAKVLAKFDGTSDKSKCDAYLVPGASIFERIGKDSFVLCLGPLDGAAATDGSTSAG